ECQLPRLSVGAVARRFLGRGREPQKRQEYGAGQSGDCGAGHEASSRLNALSRRFVPFPVTLAVPTCAISMLPHLTAGMCLNSYGDRAVLPTHIALTGSRCVR